MFLENVAAFITLKNTSTIKVTSDFANIIQKIMTLFFQKML